MLRSFNAVLADIRDNTTLSEIVRALEVGNVDAVIRLLQMDAPTWEPLYETVREAYRTGGITGAEQVGAIPTPDGRLKLRFNMRSPAAEQFLSTAEIRLVVDNSTEQIAMVREYLQRGLATGVNPRTSALDLVGRIDRQTRQRVGGIIGMTPNQERWVSNARRELEDLNPAYLTRATRDRRLDSAFKRALRDGVPMPEAQIDRAVTLMQKNVLRYRGETVAETESITALRAGQHESIEQAINVGEIDRRDAEHEWQTSGNENVRPAHSAAHGQRVPFDEPFIVGGEPLRYPGDPRGSASNTIRCHCSERTVLDFGGELRRVEGFS